MKADSKVLVTDGEQDSTATFFTAVCCCFFPISESMVKWMDFCSLLMAVVVVIVAVTIGDIDFVDELLDAGTDDGLGADCALFNRLKPNEILASSAGGNNGMAGGNGEIYG